MISKRLLAVLLLAAAATGCTASGTSGAADVAPAAPASDAGAGGGQGRGAAGERPAAEPGTAAAQVGQPGVDRKLSRTATLELTAPDVRAAAAAARDIAVRAGGYTGSEQVDQRRATITLHVPSDRLDAAVAEFSRIGEVTSSAQTAEDVTEQLVDVESRIATQRASLARVRALLAQARDIEEIVRVEAEVTRREADLESLLKRRETLAGQVAVSTVTLRIRQSGAAPPVADGEDHGLLGALATGWRAFTDALGFLLRLVAVVLPFAVVAAVVGLLGWRRWRGVRRVAREVPHDGGGGAGRFGEGESRQ